MKTAYTISAAGHAAILLWSLWSLSAKPLPSPPSEALPVELVSVSELTKMTAGSKAAPQAEAPKPLVEKMAEAKPVEDPTDKVVENKEVKAAREAPPASESKPPEPKPPEPKPPELKPPEPKPQDKKEPETKPDQIAEVLAKQETKKQETKHPEPKRAEPRPAPKNPAPPAPKFDPKKVEALLDKRDSTRLAAAGQTLNNSPSLGAPTGRAPQLSLSELDALRQRLAQLWSIPAGAQDPQELVVQIRIKLRPDGTLAAPPMVLTSGRSPLFVAARDSAIRALFRGQPFNMLRPETYELWKDIEITFDPRDMIRG
jgi:colicin import membrane protein